MVARGDLPLTLPDLTVIMGSNSRSSIIGGRVTLPGEVRPGLLSLVQRVYRQLLLD